MHLGVLGCGVIGLTTAIELQKEFPNAKVSVIADRFYDGTVSYVAAGIFEPGDSFMGPTLPITQKWINDSYYYWDDIRKSADGESAGIREVSAYYFATSNPEVVRNRYMEKLVPVYRKATEDELNLCNGGWKYGSFFKTVVTENRIYLPYATKKFLRNGGEIIEQKVNSFSDIQQNFDVLMNCTGIGAAKLCNDIQLFPIRGQVMKVRAPWVKEAYMCDYDTYIIPGIQTVTLGGCRNFGSYNTQVCKYDGLNIRERCYGMIPSLKNAELISEMVGLRPHRAIVRVEPEILHTPGGRTMKLVHNYGHGGYGVTTAPGTALYAIKIARDLLSSSNVSKL